MEIQAKMKGLFFTVMLFFSTMAMAQTSADKVFMEGQQLQKVMRVASQRNAIAKFKQAKVLYTSQDKKTMCDNQISICQNNIASLSRPRSTGSAQPAAPSFFLSQENIVFEGGKEGAFNIAVTAPTMEWNFSIPEGIEGEESFAKITRSSDAKSIDVVVEANPVTIERHQTLLVKYGSQAKSCLISQSGKPVTLSTSTNLVEFGIKGGNKKVDIFTNSDSIIPGNNDLTWFIESKPSWVYVNVDVQKKKGILDKSLTAVKGFVAGKAVAAEADDVKISSVKIQVMPLIKSDPEYLTGRKGEIVFASQDKRYKVFVVQK